MKVTQDLSALKERLGERQYVLRLEAEALATKRGGERQGRGIFRFEHRMDLYACIRRCIQLSGLWKRVVRNYFDIQVVENEVRIAHLPEAFDGYRLLQLSDLHTDLHPDFPAVVKRVIADLEHDCLVMTGDYRTATFGEHTGASEATIELLSDVEKPIFAILGNHDSLYKVPSFESVGIRFLLNENVRLEVGDDAISLIGIDDPNHYKTHCFDRAMKGVPDSMVKVLLSHSPQTYRLAAERGIDLMLSGHTHGGQICLPGGYVIMHDGTSPRRLLAGPWKEGTLQGYTSRGTGATGLPARLNCPAEVTIHILRRLD